MSDDLFKKATKLAYNNPECREELLPILKRARVGGDPNIYKTIDASKLVESGKLDDPSKLRHQAVFLMGTAGAGKSYVVESKYLKYMPDSPGPGLYNDDGRVDRDVLDKLLDRRLSDQERNLSNVSFENAVRKMKEQGFDIEFLEEGDAEIPFRLMEYTDDGKRELPRGEWKQALDEDVYEEVKGIKTVIFESPIHELPSYWRQVNPDLYKEELKGYREDDPTTVHQMSREMSRTYFLSSLEAGDPVIVDGTGRKLEKMERQIETARGHGYNTTILYIYVPLTVAMIRNATRKRKVPPLTVLDMYDNIKQNYPQLRPIADRMKYVNNENEAFDRSTWQQDKDRINAFFLEETGMTLPQFMLEFKPDERDVMADLGVIEPHTTPQDLIKEHT